MVALAAIWLWVYLLMSPAGRRDIGLGPPNQRKWWFLGPLIGFLTIAITATALWLFFGWSERNMLYDMASAIQAYIVVPHNAVVWATWVLLYLGWLVQSPLLEEPLFRGFMQTGYSRQWGIWLAIIVQSIAFTLVHPFNSFSWPISIFIAGVVYGLITYHSRSIWPAVLAHSAYNLGVVWISFNYVPDVGLSLLQ
jgi:hypothetical protein